MDLNTKLYKHMQSEASHAVISQLHLGLGYSALTLEDGRCGLCSTWIDGKASCTLFKESFEVEGSRADVLLEKLSSQNTITRTAVIALINALNYRYAEACEDDPGTLFDDLGLISGSSCAMVGYFGPVVKQLESAGITVHAYDIGKGVGSKDEFYQWVRQDADAMIVTATSLINNSMEDVFEQLKGRALPAVVMGPSTIMIPEIYSDFPVKVLAGTVPVDVEGVLRAVRNGKGTPVIHRYSRKVYHRC
ncbi:MAG: Rossmann-like domain-containing protein [Spirochaetota bacterium]